MINLVNISKYYHSKKSVALGLRKVTLEFNKCEFVAITGESGSGKSTLLNVISGSDSYEEGELYFAGEATSHYTKEEWEDYRRDNIGFIYQGYNLIDSYTVLENVQSAILIKGEEEGSEDKAMTYLEKVGLDHLADNKAVHLSSGQKQRLAIARALAKETKVIVADEPTGNLDVENGLQVMKLLHELSQDKLIICVTHNYEQAEPYATRKIRMYNGEVAEDMDVTHLPDGTTRESAHAEDKEDFKIRMEAKAKAYEMECEESTILGEYIGYDRWDAIKSKIDMAKHFVKINRRNQPKRNLLLVCLYTFIAVAFFIFLGGLFSNMDSALSGYYSTKSFMNGDKNRIVIRKPDGSVVTAEDVEKLLSISHVKGADLYDSICDVNYFSEKNVDYRNAFRKCEKAGYSAPDSKYIELLKFDKFMRSTSGLSDEDIKAGTLPVKFGEIAIFDKDEKKLGTKMTIYISNQKLWGEKQYVQLECTITAILKQPTEQIYFSQETCKYMAVNNKTAAISLFVELGSNGRGVTSGGGLSLENYLADGIEYKNIIFIPSATLAPNTIQLGSVFYDNTTVKQGSKNMVQVKVSDEAVFRKGRYAPIQVIPEDALKSVTINKVETGSSAVAVTVSYSLFDEWFPDLDSRQISVYIENYAYTDAVIKAINSAGYEAISVYRTGITGYDQDAIMDVMKSMGISAVALVFVFLVGLFVIGLLLRLKKSDFIIFKSMGMKQILINRINSYDLYTGFGVASICAVVIAIILHWCEVEFVSNIVVYYGFSDYIIYFALVFSLAFLTGKRYNKYLSKKDSIITLRDDN